MLIPTRHEYNYDTIVSWSTEKIITYYFNYPLTTTFEQWKSSFIQPNFKSSNKYNIKNYRLIFRLSAIPKLFGKLLVLKIKIISKNIFIN